MWREISRRGRSVSIEEMRDLSVLLGSTKEMVTLDLSGCGIDMRYIDALVEILRNGAALAKVNLCQNRLGDEGIKVIARHLNCAEKLEIINIGYNGVGPAGFLALHYAIRMHPAIRAVVTRGNNLSCEEIGLLTAREASDYWARQREVTARCELPDRWQRWVAQQTGGIGVLGLR